MQFGEDCARQVNIWSAPDVETIRRGLTAKDPATTELRKILKSETVEIAVLNPIAPNAAQPGKSVTTSSEKIYALTSVTIDPSMHQEFIEQVRGERAIQGGHGVDFVASYHVQIGDTAREIDIWSASDAETIRRSFFVPDAASSTLDQVIRKEGVEIAVLNQNPPVK